MIKRETTNKMSILRVLALPALIMVTANAFAPSCYLGTTSRQMSSYSSSSVLDMSSSIVVISPPGGVGEVAAVKAACMGSSVRWFVVTSDDESGGNRQSSSSSSSSVVTLAPQTLKDIASASGNLELAGATVEELKSGGEALLAFSQWCGMGNDGLICTYDGTKDSEDYEAAIRLAANEASSNGSIKGPRVAVLAAEKDLGASTTGSLSSPDSGGGLGQVVGSLFGGGPKIPTTLPEALGSGGGEVCVVRHGQLFGLPESSPDFSPLVGGPRRDPVVTDEYTMRTVRVDPFVFSGNVMASSSSKTCRHCVGEAAALFASGRLSILKQPVSISSQAGTDEWTLEQWEQEMDRVEELVASGKASVLFEQDMIVADTERLADWLATKWAPAVMRTYDIAAIRIGARPVYATRAGDGLVQITWQELINFDSVNVGAMMLKVTSDGITATRGPGDPAKGFGTVRDLPLPGEDVLVRRLAEAAAQAVEKGLAKKRPMKKPTKAVGATPVAVSSLMSAGNVAVGTDSVVATEKATTTMPGTAVATATPPPSSTPETDGSSTGPRKAGARRSTPKSRGTKKSS